MRRFSFGRLAGALLLVLLSQCAPDVPDCSLHIVAGVPIAIQDGLPVVRATIHGHPVTLIVDAGAERTTIVDATAKRLHLLRDERYTTQSLGVGGTTTTTDVSVEKLVIGGVDFPLERAAVGNYKLHNDNGLNADGLLGADILLAYDLDIDFPAGKLTFYEPRRCPSAPLPWQQQAVAVQGVQRRHGRLLIPIEVDGVKGMAILDTGAQHDILGKEMARRLDLSSLTTMAADPVITQHGVGPDTVAAYVHQFKVLRIGPIVRYTPQIFVLEAEAGLGDAVIGEDLLRGRRLWLSYANRQIYMTPGPRP